jgi:hypothetical protein
MTPIDRRAMTNDRQQISPRAPRPTSTHVGRLLLAAALLGALILPATPPADADAMMWSDYQGKGEIQINVQDVNMSVQMEQTYCRPATMLLNLDVLGLKQCILMDGTVEQTYNPAQGIIIEKRYLNLEKSTVNPMVGAQASMEDLGRRIRESKAEVVGKETLIGFECDVIQLATKELLQKVSAGSVLNSPKILESLGTNAKAWVSRDWGLPVKIEIPGADGKPAMTFKFTELKMNTGVGKDTLRLGVPKAARRVSVTVDLADADWESKMQTELRKAVDAAKKTEKSEKTP